jgi:hypothetical protein
MSKGTVRFNKQSLNKYSVIIFDLSGVLVDFGLYAPVIATSRAFKNRDISYLFSKNFWKIVIAL